MQDSDMLCSDCNGTGRDDRKTKLRGIKDGYVMCWTCNGNGLDPAHFFRWGSHPKTVSNGQ